MPSGRCFRRCAEAGPGAEPRRFPVPSRRHFRRRAEAGPGVCHGRACGTERAPSPGRGAPKRRLLGVVAPRTAAVRERAGLEARRAGATRGETQGKMDGRRAVPQGAGAG
eukprot:3403286-Alexandrium_andersonii.AAC.1